MKTKRYFGLFISLALTVCLTGCSLTSLILGGSSSLGHGSRITLQAVETDADGKRRDIFPASDIIAAVEGVLEARLTNAGYTEARVNTNINGAVTVDLPGIDNALDVANLLDTPARLTFRNADGEVILDGAGTIKSASYEYDPTQNDEASSHYIRIEFTPEARQTFSDATAAAAAATDGNNYISIYMDDDLISSPRVSQRIDSDTCIITGAFDEYTAKLLANQINSGSLPVNLKIVSMDNNIDF